ncbi:hypothetical protein J6590_075119 [Homalodisca vitripennis]|nr:hypothetical protein J6590_075119 [Homalodisca vitripennis]
MLTWRRGYRDREGGSPKMRPLHFTNVGLTPANAPNLSCSMHKRHIPASVNPRGVLYCDQEVRPNLGPVNSDPITSHIRLLSLTITRYTMDDRLHHHHDLVETDQKMGYSDLSSINCTQPLGIALQLIPQSLISAALKFWEFTTSDTSTCGSLQFRSDKYGTSENPNPKST